MNKDKIEELIAASKLNELLHKKDVEESKKKSNVIITVVAIAALAALVTAIMGNGTSGPVYDAFKNLIDNFGNNIGTP